MSATSRFLVSAASFIYCTPCDTSLHSSPVVLQEDKMFPCEKIYMISSSVYANWFISLHLIHHPTNIRDNDLLPDDNLRPPSSVSYILDVIKSYIMGRREYLTYCLLICFDASTLIGNSHALLLNNKDNGRHHPTDFSGKQSPHQPSITWHHIRLIKNPCSVNLLASLRLHTIAMPHTTCFAAGLVACWHWARNTLFAVVHDWTLTSQ